jgi:hypothetical protein
LEIFGGGNNNTGPKIYGFDSSVLNSFYSSGVSLGVTAHASKIQHEILNGSRTLGEAVIAPWEIPQVTPQTAQEQMQRIFRAGDIIDLNDPRVTRNGDNDNFKNLFALYNGLTRARELVTFAETGAGNAYAKLLQSRLDDYMSDIKGFATGLSFDTATMLYGVRESKMTASVEFPKTISKTVPTHIGAIASTVRADPIAGLTGTETFDINITDSNGTRALAINLADITGTLNIDNVVDHINTALTNDGAAARVKVKRFNEFAYGMEFTLSATETLSFGNASTSESAVYIAGTNNVGDGSSGFVKKLDDLAAATPNEVFRQEIDTTSADNAKAVAVDSNGYVYSVGSTAGDLGDQLNQSSSDVFLRKYDPAGNLVWSRLLGASDRAEGFAVAVDGSDNVIVAGQTQARLTETAYGGNYDSFVTKFDSTGVEQWTRQAAPYADDGALVLTADASGNVFVAGITASSIDGTATHAGGNDAYVTKLDSTGALVWNEQFGGTTSDRATAIALDASGNVFVAAESGGNAVVRKYTDGASPTLAWESTIGTLNSGDTVSGLAIGSGGTVYVAGSTTNNALNGTIVQAHGGGTDGFVTKITDNGASATVNFTSYVGSAGDDTVAGIAVDTSGASDAVYVTGGTTGDLDGGGAAQSSDFYAVKLDDTGANVWSKQFRGSITHTASAIVVDSAGTDVISRLGLPRGDIPVADPTELTGLTSVRAGQTFQIAVNDGSRKSVTIEADDTLGFLAFKIKKILGNDGKVELKDGVDGKTLNIEALNGSKIEFFPGQEGFDALAPLGLREAVLHGDPAEGQVDKSSIFELGLVGTLDVTKTSTAGDAGILIDNALREIRTLYKFLADGPSDGEERPTGPVPISAADQARIANLQGTLNFVSGLVQSGQAAIQNNDGSSKSLFNLVI